MVAGPAAIVYDRASTINQRDNYSRADAARLVGLLESFGYRTELRQEIKSGEDLTNRPVMRQILQEIADGRVAAIGVQHLDRLSRDQDQIDGRIIRQVCRDAGCVVVTPDKTYDFAADVDDDLADVQFLMAKFQKRALVRQMVTGMKEAARQGKKLPSLIMVSYDVVYLPPDRPDMAPVRDFAVNDAEAALIRRIFDLYERHSQTKVAKILNAEGVRWPVKNPGLQAKYGRVDMPFTGPTVYNVVRCELFAGFVTWGRKKRSRLLQDFETARVFRADLQIVSLEQWNRVQRIREERKRVPPRSVSSPFLFSGLIKCPHCGGAMSGVRRRDRTAPSYVCSLRGGGGTAACRGQVLSESFVRAAVTRFLEDLFTDRILLEPFVESAARRYGSERLDDELVQEIKSDLQVLENQKRNLIDAVATGVLRGADIAAKNVELKEQRERLQHRLDTVGARRELRSEIAAATRLLQGGGLAARIAQLPDPALQRLCRLVLRRFTCYSTGRGHVRICEVDSYELTPEFADFLARYGSHASDFAGPKPLGVPYHHFDDILAMT